MTVNARSRVGLGFDIHRLGRGRKLVLGGLEIECNVGLVGHSDGDVVLHAVTDAVLGACGMGDIGDHFPSSDPRWEGASSRVFLDAALDMADKAGFDFVNCDTIIVAERPHLGAWKEGIRSSLAGILGLGVDRVCVKAKTSEGLGHVGEGRAIEAHAVVMLRKRASTKKARKPAKRAAKKSR
ncbi:MAG: 2-C-methyl-D-erythritol 2,4-cyclodiphosphate synthase [Planctomycetes bacterium]|nr:2-C-methyl-D-erythritol 2,4-cyclodiphosphate synthase [Planctomycetota bacterium]